MRVNLDLAFGKDGFSVLQVQQVLQLLRVPAQCHRLLLAVGPVVPSQQLAAGWGNPDVENSAFLQPVRLLARFCPLHFKVSQRHSPSLSPLFSFGASSAPLWT